MGGTPFRMGSWGPNLQLDMENWIVFLEVLDLTYNILDFVQWLFFPDDLLKIIWYARISAKNYSQSVDFSYCLIYFK